MQPSWVTAGPLPASSGYRGPQPGAWHLSGLRPCTAIDRNLPHGFTCSPPTWPSAAHTAGRLGDRARAHLHRQRTAESSSQPRPRGVATPLGHLTARGLVKRRMVTDAKSAAVAGSGHGYSPAGGGWPTPCTPTWRGCLPPGCSCRPIWPASGYSASTPERPHAAAAAQGGAGSVIEIQILRALAPAAVGQETAAAEAPVHWRRQ